MIKTALATLVLVAALGAGQAFAATSTEVEMEDSKPVCAFVAEIGGYQCIQPVDHASLSEPNDGNGKKKLLIVKAVNPQIFFP